MFTGIIEDIAKVVKKESNRLIISTNLDDINVSDSISVNGVCLTVENIKIVRNESLLEVSCSLETLRRTNLGLLKVSDKVNLERALKFNSRISGHFVTGHIDTTIRLLEINNEEFTFEIPQEYSQYIVEKGSVTLDGISLTVAKRSEEKFTVAVIPYTLNNTTLKYKKPKDIFNLEVDILAKYIKSLIQKDKSSIDIEFLKKHGFI
ncbi:MAG: riboflavin synthase [Endomicrobia bacterium]|nr:riboflavin synthase [Endomicrobiia bacterium]